MVGVKISMDLLMIEHRSDERKSAFVVILKFGDLKPINADKKILKFGEFYILWYNADVR